VLDRCFFQGTVLQGSLLSAGEVLLLECAFSDDAESTTRFTASGTQVTHTVTVLEFGTKSLLATCGGQAGVPRPRSPPIPRSAYWRKRRIINLALSMFIVHLA
jgi:hypothetical protein